MDVLKILVVFGAIFFALNRKKPLYIAMLIGAISIVFLYQINIQDVASITFLSATNLTTISILLSFYVIVVLQKMMEHKDHTTMAYQALEKLFNSKRVNVMVTPFIIGLMPSAGIAKVVAPIVEKSSNGYLKNDEQAVVGSFYRHLSESFLPTYAHVLLAVQLAGISMSAFVFSMLPMVLVLFVLGFVFYVRKIPKGNGVLKCKCKYGEWLNLLHALWPLLLAIMIVLVFETQVYVGVIVSVLLSFLFNKFAIQDMFNILMKSFDYKVLLAIIIIMIFKDLLVYTDVITHLPEALSFLPIPFVVLMIIIIFMSSFMLGGQATVALFVPFTYSVVVDGGAALMVIIMSAMFMASQISPVHICLTVFVNYFNSTFSKLVKKMIPIVVSFLFISALYSYFLYSLY